jgi:zinc protease
MNRIRKIALLLAVAAFTPAAVHAAAAAKEAPPAPGPLKNLSFPAYTEQILKNGLDVVVVEHHEQPVASLWMAIKAGSVLDPEGKSSLASYTGSLLNKGSKGKRIRSS